VYRLVTPTTEDLNLISLDEAREFLYIDQNDYPDSDLTKMLAAARTHVEAILQRAVLESGWEYFQDSFFKEYFNESSSFVNLDRTNAITIPRPELLAVSEIIYFDSINEEQTLPPEEYYVNLVGDFLKAQIEPSEGNTWPSTFYRKNAIKVSYTAGWLVDEVPADVRHGVLISLGDLYENRQTNITGMSTSTVKTLNALLSPYKVDNV